MEDISIPNFDPVSILVYGDVMLDRYWYGDTSRISPEAPVPVVNIQTHDNKAGGAANVALNIEAIGGQSLLMGVIGDDPESHLLKEALEATRIETHLRCLPGYRTTTKLRIVGQNQQLIRLDFEQLPFAIDEELLQDYEEKLQHVQVVILSDYAKGTLLNPLPFIARARKRGLPVLVDPKHVDFRLYRGATVITPNLKEFEQAVGHCHSEAEMVEKARELIHSCELGALLITRGKDGMLLIQAHEPPLAISATAREVYDVTGAGDTVIGLLGACLATGMSLSEAAKVANLAAGLVVGKLGAATVTVPELKRALLQAHDHHSGLLTQAQLLEVVSTAKAHGEKIVMTNGCFDILHAGHIQYLEQAKALGDYLIVAVNDDDSVRRLKGPLRPLNTLEDRLYTVASLRAVDAVIPFSEDTPAALVEAILPDYLVKGGDYRVEEIAGSATVIAAGGQVIILDFKPGCSTSGLLERIVERHSVGELS